MLRVFFYFAQYLLLPSSILKGNMLKFIQSVLQKALITRNSVRYWETYAQKWQSKKEICLLKWKDVPDATICGKFNILIRALCQKRASTCGLRFNYFKKTHAKCANKNLMNCQIRWKSIQIFLCFSQKIQDNPKIGFIILLTTWPTMLGGIQFPIISVFSLENQSFHSPHGVKLLILIFPSKETDQPRPVT